jgi:hypothetical protein
MLLGVEEKALDADYVIADEGIMGHMFDPNGSDRIITLPTHSRGKLIVVSNTGTANSLAVKNAGGTTIATVYFGETHFFFGTTVGWTSTADVFTPAGASASTGLVPRPPLVASASGSEKFLREDGTWADPGFAGSDAYATISDGTNTANASGSDNIKFRTANNILAIVVTDNDVTHGDNALFTITEANINHDALTNYVADQHIAHSGVSINTAANSGLAGGGTIAASRSLTLDINNLTADTPVLADSFAFYDAGGLDTNKATLSTLNGILDHNALLNYVADQHVAHSGVSITAGGGLTGGGTIDASRTISLDITGQSGAAPALADEIIYWDADGLDFDKCTFTQLNGVLDHNSLLNYVAAQHAAHPGLSTDNAIARYDGAAGALQNSGVTIDDSNNVAGVVALAVTTIELGHATDTTLSRTGAGAIAVEGVGVALNSISLPHTMSQIELGHASDTSITRTGAGAIAVEGVGVALNSITLTHTALQIELGHASDTTISRNSAGNINVEGRKVVTISQTETFSVGFTVAPNSLGNMTNFTANPALGNYQYGTNNAAFTLTAPATDCAIDILVTNHATTAGTITFSGFTAPAGGGGDTYATTGNNRYLLSIRRINAISTYMWKALQ